MMAADMPGAFVRIGSVAEVPPGTGRGFTVEGYEVAVFNVAGQFYALENHCPHQGGPLADGWLEGTNVTCPWHAWCFDVRTGKMTLGDFAFVPRFAVEQRGADLYLCPEPIL